MCILYTLSHPTWQAFQLQGICVDIAVLIIRIRQGCQPACQLVECRHVSLYQALHMCIKHTHTHTQTLCLCACVSASVYFIVSLFLWAFALVVCVFNNTWANWVENAKKSRELRRTSKVDTHTLSHTWTPAHTRRTHANAYKFIFCELMNRIRAFRI